jgi:hypothetical protein
MAAIIVNFIRQNDEKQRGNWYGTRLLTVTKLFVPNMTSIMTSVRVRLGFMKNEVHRCSDYSTE